MINPVKNTGSYEFPQISEKSLKFQQGIKEGNINLIKVLISQDQLFLTQSLPNGQLPLHFAVRNGKQEIVTLLLENNVNPELKDEQNLSAIDHAVLDRNDAILALLVAHKFKKNFQELQEQIKLKDQLNVVDLKKRIDHLSQINIYQLSPLCQAAYEGNFIALNDASAMEINVLDKNGLAPIHYAVLGKQPAALQMLVQKGGNPHILTSKGESLLHLVAIWGFVPNIEMLY